MTAYERHCAEVCKNCAKGLKVEYPGFGNGKRYHFVHTDEYQPGEPFERCTAPPLAEYAETQDERLRRVLMLLRRYVSNDAANSCCDELTVEANTVLEAIDRAALEAELEAERQARKKAQAEYVESAKRVSDLEMTLHATEQENSEMKQMLAEPSELVLERDRLKEQVSKLQQAAGEVYELGVLSGRAQADYERTGHHD